MDKSRRLPPLGAPTTRALSSSEPHYAPLSIFDSQSPQPNPQQQQQQQQRLHQQQQQHQHPPSHTLLPSHSRPPPATSSPLFPPSTSPMQRSPPLPVSSDAAVSKPKKLHREVEQRRRMRMAEQIAELRQCVSDPNSGKTDKVSILQDAVAFVKAAKRTIHSLQYKLQAAESEVSRLVAVLTEMQPNLLRQQPHQGPPSLPAHAQLHIVPNASSLVASTSSQPPTSHAQQLPSNVSARPSAFNFESVVPQSSLREAAAASTRSVTPTTDMLHAPIAQQGASWNTFASSAQPFPHAAVSAPSHQPPHFSNALHRTHSRPSHSSLPHLRTAQHQQQRHSVVGAHPRAPYASMRNSHLRSEPPSQMEQHQQLRHQSHLKPTPPVHQHQRISASRATQDVQTTALAHPGDQASISTNKAQRHLQ